MKKFTLIAHRGLSADAPENTDASIRLAIEKGINNIELDVQLTNDGVPVIIHDSTVDRTTDGEGSVAGLSLTELKTLDAGEWFGAQFKDERIMTLAEVLNKYGWSAKLHIELKSEQIELAKKVSTEIERAGLLEQKGDAFTVPGIVVTSFYLPQLQRSLALLPNFMHGWLVDHIDEAVVKAALQNGIMQLCPRAENVTANEVELAHLKGICVRGWGVKTVDDLHRLQVAGADGATVNSGE